MHLREEWLHIDSLKRKSFRKEPKSFHRIKRYSVEKGRFEVAICQRHVGLLGRSIDMNRLLSQYIRRHLRKDFNVIIQRFESESLYHIIDFQKMLGVIRFTHGLMVDAGVDLEPFENLYRQEIDNKAPTSFNHRVMRHIARDLLDNVLQWAAYNHVTRRFVTGAEVGESEFTRREPPRKAQIKEFYMFGKQCRTAYEQLCTVTHGYFGAAHIKAIVEILSPAALPILVREISRSIGEKLNDVLGPFLLKFGEELPLFPYPNTMTQETFNASALFLRFQGQLLKLGSYTDLRPIVMHSFREIGNSVLFVEFLEEALAAKDRQTFMVSKPIFGIPPSRPEDENFEEKLKVIKERTVRRLTINGAQPVLPPLEPASKETPSIEKALDQLKDSANEHVDKSDKVWELWEKARRASQIAQYTTCRASLVGPLLNRLVKLLKSDELKQWKWPCTVVDWAAASKRQQSLNKGGDRQPNADPSRFAFHHLWSMIVFMFCMSEVESPDAPDKHIFGDGFVMGGAALLHALGQHQPFELLDISGYLLAIFMREQHDYPQIKGQVGVSEQEAKRIFPFFLAARSIAHINENFCSILQACHKPPDMPSLVVHPPNNDEVLLRESRPAPGKPTLPVTINFHAPLPLTRKERRMKKEKEKHHRRREKEYRRQLAEKRRSSRCSTRVGEDATNDDLADGSASNIAVDNSDSKSTLDSSAGPQETLPRAFPAVEEQSSADSNEPKIESSEHSRRPRIMTSATIRTLRQSNEELDSALGLDLTSDPGNSIKDVEHSETKDSASTAPPQLPPLPDPSDSESLSSISWMNSEGT